MKFNESQRPPQELQEQFNRLFDHEVALQKVADVPVGLYLSGGIDSGALVAGFAKDNPRINAFTMAFTSGDPEIALVERLSRHYRFEKNQVTFTQNDFSVLKEAVLSLEEPFGDLIICANFILARHACSTVRVVLSGEGGDESFCGYDHQRAFMKMSGLAASAFTRSPVSLFLKYAPPGLVARLNSYPGSFGAPEQKRIEKVFGKMHEPVQAYMSLVSLFDRDALAGLFSADFKKDTSLQPDTGPLESIFASEEKTWRAIMRAEIEQLTLSVNLLKQDRFGMHFSLEGRVPLVSKKVLEFAASLPFSELFPKINKKFLLRYARAPLVKKRPFALPAGKVFSAGVRSLFDAHVGRRAIEEAGILSWDAVEQLRPRINRGGIISVKQAMSLIVFMVWWDQFKQYLR